MTSLFLSKMSIVGFLTLHFTFLIHNSKKNISMFHLESQGISRHLPFCEMKKSRLQDR